MPADLHIHTNFSDGLLSPEDMVRQAKKAGLTTIAVTDHDTVDGVARAIEEGAKVGVRVIPGIEFTTDVPEAEVHILGYFIDHKAEWLLELLKKIREDRVARLYKMLDKLGKLGIKIDPQEILTLVDLGSVGRPHVARALLSKGKVRSIQEAFDKYLDFGAPAYVAHFKLTPMEAIATIRKAGGVSVLAHPGVSDMDGIITDLVSSGLMGIEVYYSKHTREQVNHYLQMTEKYGLLATGGSDFHGSVMRDVALGDIKVPDDVVNKIEEKLKKYGNR